MKMAGMTQNGQKSLIFIVVSSIESNWKYLVLLIERSCSYKDNDSSDKSKIMIMTKIVLVSMIAIAIWKYYKK